MRRYGWVLLAASAWTLYVWITRVWLLVRQDATASFKTVHLVIAGVSLGFAMAVGWIGLRLLRDRR